MAPIKEDQILKAALELFQQHGISKVTMDDVAKAIGMGRSSLYYYYKSKEEIFDAVMDMEIAEILADTGRAVNEVSSVEEKIRVFCITKINTHLRKKVVYNALEAGMDAEALHAHAKIKQGVHQRYMKQEGALLRQILTEGIARGELRDSPDLDTLIFVLLTALRGLKKEMVIEWRASAVETLANLILNGLKK